jgi:uncharacterized protein (TIGR00251 family)
MLNFDVKVIPNAKLARFILDTNGKIRVYVTSQPEKNKANNELVSLFAKKLNIPKNDIEIISGHISPYKKIRIHKPLTMVELLGKLGLETQKSFIS